MTLPDGRRGFAFLYQSEQGVIDARGWMRGAVPLAAIFIVVTGIWMVLRPIGSRSLSQRTLFDPATLAANIYGAGTVIVDGSMLTACIATLDTAEQRLQAGNVLTGSMTELRDEVDAIVALFSAMESAEN